MIYFFYLFLYKRSDVWLFWSILHYLCRLHSFVYVYIYKYIIKYMLLISVHKIAQKSSTDYHNSAWNMRLEKFFIHCMVKNMWAPGHHTYVSLFIYENYCHDVLSTQLSLYVSALRCQDILSLELRAQFVFNNTALVHDHKVARVDVEELGLSLYFNCNADCAPDLLYFT